MARRARPYWICQGCHHRNLRQHIKCRTEGCKRTRPKKRVPKHAEVLRDMPYDQGWPELSVQIHGGELHACGVCGRMPKIEKNNDRDHDHRKNSIAYGKARGLACFRCNSELLRNTTLEEARLVVAYLERVDEFYKHQAERGQVNDE